MKVIDFVDLLSLKDLRLFSLFAVNQLWINSRSFSMKSPRKQSAFLWFRGMTGRYLLQDGTTIEVPENALVYIPQDAVYELMLEKTVPEGMTVLVELCLNDGEPFVLSERIGIVEHSLTDGAIADLIVRIVREYNKPSKRWLVIQRYVLELLYLLAQSEEKKSISHKGFKTIEKGIAYLQKDEKQLLTIDEIAGMCYVTPAYFRRLFREYSGMSPTEYRTHMKIERAKALMEHTNLSVAELSLQLGYADPSYFSRVFKKETGMNPKDYQRLDGRG